jgi:hypothetical protein
MLASIRPPEDKYTHNVLFSKTIPNWVNPEDLKMIFQEYSRSPGYPKIKFIKNQSGNCYVFLTFCPKTSDASFALVMNKKLFISKGENSALVFFSYAYDRTKN